MNEKINKLLKDLTLEEKAGLCSGDGWWHTKSVERLGIPKIMVSDGPAGLRTQQPEGKNENDSIVAVSFPSGCCTACSFDRDLLFKEGEILANEANAVGVSIILGPAINMKRSPLCGRNFEYMSEDPYVAGELATAYTKGVQSKNVGVSVKHFAANNQEYRRFSVSEKIDERTLREIYLPAFETVVKNAQPKNIMCSYNAINGVLSSENKWLLTDVLRNEWGFNGFVVSDWGAVNDRILGIQAGLNLEMPNNNRITQDYIIEAVNNGRLEMVDLDKCVSKLLEFVFEYTQNKLEGKWDKKEDHLKSAEIAEESCVLLKNEKAILPLSTSGNVLFAGYFAEKPRFEGGGSSNVNHFEETSALKAAKDMGICVTYAQGYCEDGCSTTESLLADAVEKAKNASTVVVFAGLPDLYESEGFDRNTLDMPEAQNLLIEKLAEVNKNVIVVLHNGAPVTMPWESKVSAILECYLGGEAIGIAQIRLLYGFANPSGKLAETFPLKLEDTPAYLNFPGNGRTVTYAEGVFIGYRWYDTRKMQVLYPFGHGLSYTSFEYIVENDLGEGDSSSEKSIPAFKDTDLITVPVKVKNTGKRAGKEVVQLYVRDLTGVESRPDKELKGFEKIYLEPGEEKTIEFTLDKRSFAFWSEDIHDWYAPSGEYEILIGSSSRDIRYSQIINIESTTKKPFTITRWTTGADLADNPEMFKKFKSFLDERFDYTRRISSEEKSSNVAFSEKSLLQMALNSPFRCWRNPNQSDEEINKMIERMNQED